MDDMNYFSDGLSSRRQRCDEPESAALELLRLDAGKVLGTFIYR